MDRDILEEELSQSTLNALKNYLSTENDDASFHSKTDDQPSQASLPKKNEEYYKKEYWESRFTSEEEYEWLISYDDVKAQLAPRIKKTDQILVVGCGNSSLSADMYDDGYRSITNIDFSSVVIENMMNKYQDKEEMLWLEMDMLNLQFSAGQFDVVLDKAAMDALTTVEGDPWNPNQEILDQAHQMCTGITRVLKDNGLFLQISFAQPHFRRKYLLGTIGHKEGCNYYSESYSWSLEYEDIVQGERGCFGHFLYVMQKKSVI
mmetsp:Transcript_23828/g.30856  ORF Transcript_23828/g.30856 Transcript_23828/m.30856 type:complete len:262 (+) Transcript_23828:59-844(+)